MLTSTVHASTFYMSNIHELKLQTYDEEFIFYLTSILIAEQYLIAILETRTTTNSIITYTMSDEIDWVKESGLSQLEIDNLDKADYDLCKSIHNEEKKLLSKVDIVYDERITELEKRKQAVTYQIRMQYQNKIVQCVRANISMTLIKGILGDKATNNPRINNIVSDSLAEIHTNYKNKYKKTDEDYGLYSTESKHHSSLQLSDETQAIEKMSSNCVPILGDPNVINSHLRATSMSTKNNVVSNGLEKEIETRKYGENGNNNCNYNYDENDTNNNIEKNDNSDGNASQLVQQLLFRAERERRANTYTCRSIYDRMKRKPTSESKTKKHNVSHYSYPTTNQINGINKSEKNDHNNIMVDNMVQQVRSASSLAINSNNDGIINNARNNVMSTLNINVNNRSMSQKYCSTHLNHHKKKQKKNQKIDGYSTQQEEVYGMYMGNFLFETKVNNDDNESNEVPNINRCNQSTLFVNCSRNEKKSSPNTNIKDRPYTCNLCQQSFDQVRKFHQHIRTHTAEKPFHCNICKRKFATSADKNQHILIHCKDFV